MKAQQLDVPLHETPDYRTLVRHAWQYRDELGRSPIGAPPNLYEVYVEGHEITVIDEMHRAMRAVEPNWCDRIVLEGDPGDNVRRLTFTDFAALHTFLGWLATAARVGDTSAGQACEFILFTLGFRWIGGRGYGDDEHGSAG